MLLATPPSGASNYRMAGAIRSGMRGILPIIYQNGGDIISPDGTKVTGYLDSDATVAALQWYTDFFTKYKVAPSKADVAALSGQDLFADR